MNRNMLNLNTFDPAPMALGERTTRQPAEPVNPRAAFEAFERGDHQVGGGVIPLARPRSQRFTSPFEQFTPDLVRKMVKALGVSYEALAQPVPLKPFPKLTTTATAARGPEPDDGEGDTPDIMDRILSAGEKLNDRALWRKIRACFLDPGEMPEAKPCSPTMRYVQALERAVRKTQQPVTLAMCYTLFNHQKHAGRDVARVMRSFGINDTRELGTPNLRAAFFACLVNL